MPAELPRHPGPAFMAAAFEWRLYSRDEVADWVAREIDRHATLPEALVELTALKDRGDSEIETLLRALGPSQTSQARARTDMAVLHHFVQAGRLLFRHAIFRATLIADWLSPEEYHQVLLLADACDRSESHVERTFAELSERYAGFTDD